MKLKPKQLGDRILWPLLGLLIILITLFSFLVWDLNSRRNEIAFHISQTKQVIEQSHELATLEKFTEMGMVSYRQSPNKDLEAQINSQEERKQVVASAIASRLVSVSDRDRLARYITLHSQVFELEKQVFSSESPQQFNERFVQWDIKRTELDGVFTDIVSNLTGTLGDSIALVNNTIIQRAVIFSLTIAFVIIFIVLLYLYLTKTITSPLLKLTRYARAISENKFDEQLDIVGNDELSLFAQDLHTMALKLQETYQGMHEAVNEKTSELSQKIIELQREQMKANAILESMGDGLVVTDRQGCIMLMNEEAESVLGYSVEELRGKSWFGTFKLYDEKGNMVPDEKRPMSRALLFKRKFTAPQVYYMIRKNGTKVPLSVSVTPLIIDGHIIGLIEVFRDVSSETAVDKAKSEFVSLASHQLRTPISAINWYSEALLHNELGELNNDQRRYLENIYASNQRMIALVNTLLNISRLELGTFNVKLQLVNIPEIPRSVIEELKADIKAKKIIIQQQYDGMLPVIQTDPDLLRIIFQNLISNAVKYTPKGGSVQVQISHIIKQGKEEGDEGVVFIKVSDTGYGIPKAQQEKVFSKLFRGDNVRQIDTDGTGLGLYIVKSVIDFYEGEIWFESAENLGTQFYINLPMATLHKEGVPIK